MNDRERLRPRFTLRTLMVLVTIAAALFGWESYVERKEERLGNGNVELIVVETQAWARFFARGASPQRPECLRAGGGFGWIWSFS